MPNFGQLASAVDGFLGTRIWGNTNGAKYNLIGMRDLWAASTSGLDFDPAVRAVADHARDYGFAPLKPYPASIMEPIREKYRTLIESNTGSVDVSMRNCGLARTIVMPQDTIPEMRALLTPEVISIIEAYYGGHFEVIQLASWRIWGPTEEQLAKYAEIFSERWHFDKTSTAMFKLFINLSDVGPNDGPFHILPLGVSRGLVRGGLRPRNALGRSVPGLDDNPALVRGIGPIGSALFGNTTTCLHRAGVPKPGVTRDMIQFQFMPSKTPLAAEWWKSIVPTTAEKKFLEARAQA